MRAHLIRSWVVAFLAMLAVALVVGPARAHAELESSDPADAATLASAPSEITLTFGEDLLAEGNAVTLTHVATGDTFEMGPVEVDGDTVSAAWPEASPAGGFRAEYRVVSSDGHPVEGAITFSVEEPLGAASALSAVAAGSTADASATVTPSTATSEPVVTASTPPASPSAAPDEASDDGASVLVWVVGVGLAILLGAVAGTWVMRRTR